MIDKKINECQVLLIGHFKVGKTSIITKYCGILPSSLMSSTGVDFYFKNIPINNIKCRIKIFDYVSSSLEMVEGWNRSTQALGILCIFDITKRQTFEWIKNRLTNMLAKKIDEEERPIYYLVGNKSDLNEKRQVNLEEITNFCKQLKIKYFECSAINGNEINTMFIYLFREILEKKKMFQDKKKLKITYQAKCLIF